MLPEEEPDFDEFDEYRFQEEEIQARGQSIIPSVGNTSKHPVSALRQIRTLASLSAIAHLGGAPILRREFEELLYFIDCLLPAIGKGVWEGVGIKAEDHPLRPDWSDEIDRLIGRGLVSVHRVNEKKPIRLHCELELTAAGKRIINICRQTVQEIDEAWNSAIDIGGAYLKLDSLRSYSDSPMVNFDEAFSNTKVPQNGVIDYGEFEDLNLSSDKAKELYRALRLRKNDSGQSRLSPQVYMASLVQKERQND